MRAETGSWRVRGPRWRVLPYVNAAQAAHPAYQQSLDRLRGMEVLIGSYEPHRPEAGGGADRFRWEEALDLLEPKLK